MKQFCRGKCAVTTSPNSKERTEYKSIGASRNLPAIAVSKEINAEVLYAAKEAVGA